VERIAIEDMLYRIEESRSEKVGDLNRVSEWNGQKRRIEVKRDK
jgi:hypothetical protein